MTTLTAEMIEVSPIKTDSAKEYNDRAVSLSKQITTLQIKDQSSYENAAALLKAVKDIGKMAEDARKKITTPLDQAKAAVMDLFRPTSTALENLERHLKSIMITYANEQERIRREQEEKLRKAAQAEEDRKRKALEERAAKAAAEGKTEKAEELQQKAAEVHIQAPTLAPTVQKVAGVSMKKNWKARIIALESLPREHMLPDLQKLDKIAKATQGSLVIPGVEFFSEDILASR